MIKEALLCIENVKKKNLKFLDLRFMQIKDISFLKDLTQLSTLIISGNQINDISHLKNLTQLTSLYLYKNQLNDISPLKDLIHLSMLDLGENQIDDISSLRNLSQLTHLYLQGNMINDIFPLKDLIQLNTLNLSMNQVRDISPLNSLIQLNTLDLNTNQISDILPLKNLLSLKTVNLNFNQINYLPSWVIERNFIINNHPVAFTQGYFTIQNNPLTHPPSEIIEQGHNATVHFIKEFKKGEEQLYEAKLLLVGEGGVGKTTLLKKIKNSKAKMPTKEERTRGIDIVQYSFKNEEGINFNINIWDFGGQDIYHATHRFFLTRRSFYVLMTDTRRQDDNFDYWIPNIRLFAGQSPILIVKNLMDGFPKHISIVQYKRDNTFNIVDKIRDVNLKNNDGLKRLKQTIHFHVQQLPLIGQTIPRTWKRIRNVIKKLTKEYNYISFDRFIEVCLDNNLEDKTKDKDRIKELGKYFHDLGIILWYYEIGILKNKVILNPYWATGAVYLIIDDYKIQKQHGWFTKEDAYRVWNDAKYSNMIDELIELMKAFRLCYKKKNKEEYIIPSLLFPDPPEQICWDNTDNLRLLYYYEFMPKGLVNQLTAELSRYIEDDECAWRWGVVFKDKEIQDKRSQNKNEKALEKLLETRAKVEEDRNSRLIRINVKGMNKAGFLKLLMDSLAEIHETYHGIEVTRQVPCPCDVCANKSTPTIFEYEKLIRYMADGRREVYCNEGAKFLQIEKILFAIGLHHTKSKYGDNITQNRETIKCNSGHSYTRPLELFICYSKDDIEYAEKLKKCLKPLEREGEIKIWYDRDMLPSVDFDNEIKKHLDKADIILFLVSFNFLSTDYIWDIEIPMALAKHNMKVTKAIPIILSPCPWESKSNWFSKLLVLPDKGEAITSFKNENEAWLKVFNGVKKIVDVMLIQ